MQSVREGEPDNQPEVSAGDQETPRISAVVGQPGGLRAWGWMCAVRATWGNSVGHVALQTFYS